MSMRRITAIAAVSLAGFALLPVTVQALEPATATLSTECFTGGGFVKVALSGVTIDDVNVVIDGQTESPYADVGSGAYLFGILDEGPHSVVVEWPGHDNLADDSSFEIACDPYISLSIECREPGDAFLTVVINDESDTHFDIYLNQTLAAGNVPPGPHEFAVDANVEIDVAVDWLESNNDEVAFTETTVIECEDPEGDGGSGAGLPDAGSHSAPILLAAGLLMALGLGLVGLRRFRSA